MFWEKVTKGCLPELSEGSPLSRSPIPNRFPSIILSYPLLKEFHTMSLRCNKSMPGTDLRYFARMDTLFIGGNFYSPLSVIAFLTLIFHQFHDAFLASGRCSDLNTLESCKFILFCLRIPFRYLLT